MIQNLLNLRTGLIAALILNIVLIGVLAGGVLGCHHGPWKKHMRSTEMRHDLSPQERRDLRRQLVHDLKDVRPYYQQLHAQHQALQNIVRGDPLDTIELKAALDQLQAMEAQMRATLYTKLLEMMPDMSPEQRLHMLHRLRLVSDQRPHDRDHGENRDYDGRRAYGERFDHGGRPPPPDQRP